MSIMDFIFNLGHKNSKAILIELRNVGANICFSTIRNLSSGFDMVSTSRPKITEPITFKEYLKTFLSRVFF